MTASTSDTARGSFQVFISHRGEQMTNGLAESLGGALDDRGISSIESVPVEHGSRKDFTEAVRGASIHVPILTKKYVTSNFCLDKLVEAMDCKRNQKAKVFPVHCNGGPEELRILAGKLNEYLQDCESGGDWEELKEYLQYCESGEETIERWKEALTDASRLEGFRLEQYNGHERKLISALVEETCDELDNMQLVGLNDKIQELVQLLKTETNVFVVLIWGTEGLGKTTLAQAIYHLCKKNFEGASFVKNCGKKTEIEIQDCLRDALLGEKCDMAGNVDKRRACLHKGLRQKKVLIVMDNMDNMKDHFSCVQRVINPEMLYPGSRIILTSRDRAMFPREEDLSTDFKGRIYDLQKMEYEISMQLFCSLAFSTTFAEPDFQNETAKVVKACDGVPLFLVRHGQELRGIKDREKWHGVITKLGNNKDKEISGTHLRETSGNNKEKHVSGIHLGETSGTRDENSQEWTAPDQGTHTSRRVKHVIMVWDMFLKSVPAIIPLLTTVAAIRRKSRLNKARVDRESKCPVERDMDNDENSGLDMDNGTDQTAKRT